MYVFSYKSFMIWFDCLSIIVFLLLFISLSLIIGTNSFATIEGNRPRLSYILKTSTKLSRVEIIR